MSVTRNGNGAGEAFKKLYLWKGTGGDPTAFPSWDSGTGAPSASDVEGSFYSRSTGTIGAYVRVASNWRVIAALGEAWTQSAAVILSSTLAVAGALTSTSTITTTRGVASGTALKVGGLGYASVAASTAITGTTETETLFSTQYSLPADSLAAGTVLRIRAQGIHTATTGSEDHSMILKIGSVAISTMAAIDPANSDLFYFDCLLVCRTAGGSGTVVATGTQLAQAATGVGTAKPFFLASTTLDTTAANIIGVAIDRQTTATDSDSARLDILTVEVVG